MIQFSTQLTLKKCLKSLGLYTAENVKTFLLKALFHLKTHKNIYILLHLSDKL